MLRNKAKSKCSQRLVTPHAELIPKLKSRHHSDLEWHPSLYMKTKQHVYACLAAAARFKGVASKLMWIFKALDCNGQTVLVILEDRPSVSRVLLDFY